MPYNGLTYDMEDDLRQVNKEGWKRFEEAVARFAKALDPTAAVLFDHRVPDRETGKPRQCDAWINAKYGGHWPITIYISCKDRSKSKRKLGSPDIDVFSGEILARGASMGVVYTNTGFSGPALEKARKKGIPCCRLYRNESADIPEAVWIKQFVCKPSIMIRVLKKPQHWSLTTWDEVFNRSSGDGLDEETVLDVVVRDFLDHEQMAFDAVKVKGAPPDDWETRFELSESGWQGRLVFAIRGHWKAYAAKVEGVLLDGSYSFTDQGFKGSVEGPFIDTQSAHPGEHWEEIDPREISVQTNRLVCVMYCDDVGLVLRSNYGTKPVPEPEAEE